MIPVTYEDIRKFRDASLKSRPAAGVEAPSELWDMGGSTFEYLRYLPDWELKHIRRHTYHITGDIYIKYLYFGEGFRAQHLREYEILAGRLNSTPTEGPSGIGFDFGKGPGDAADISRMQGVVPSSRSIDASIRVSTDLLRYMQVCDDLQSSAVLERSRAQTVLEIGGGYGGLAAVLLQYNPQLTYVIVDLEETQFLQAVYLAGRFGFDRLRLCADGLSSRSLEPGCFHLVPQQFAETVQVGRFDLALNQQSMQEMTQPQVQRYGDVMSHCAEYFYSCNLDRHSKGFSEPMGLVQNLGSVLRRAFGEPTWESRPKSKLQKTLGKLTGQRVSKLSDASLPRATYKIRRGS